MEIILRFALGFMKIVAWIIEPVYWMASRNSKKVPPIKNDLLLISATELSARIRKRHIKSEDIVKAYIERIREVNPIINAVVEDRFLDALEEARAVDAYLSSTLVDEVHLKIEKPLLGVPMTVKESCALKGMSYAVGSKPRLGLKAGEDGAAVKLLRNAGAIPLLVSNTPEYCLYWESNNQITGCTRNPYNTKRSSAGSSGGEGALLGAGASLIGIGSDLAGSVRLPALFNGVFGHKATPNIVSVDGHFPSSKNEKILYYLSIGPMTRYAEDLPLMFKVMAGDNADKLNLHENVNLNDLNVFSMCQATSSMVMVPVQTEIQDLINTAVRHLKSRGSITCDYKFDLSNSCEMASSIFFSLKNIPNILHEPMNGKEPDELSLELLKSLFGSSKYSKNGLFFTFIKTVNGFVPKWRTRHYERELSELRRIFLEKLGSNGVFIYPTFPCSAFRNNELLMKMSGVMYLTTFNLLGFPCTHIPMGLNKQGLPIGLQVVAAPYQDRLCFAVAKELENVFGGWKIPI